MYVLYKKWRKTVNSICVFPFIYVHKFNLTTPFKFIALVDEKILEYFNKGLAQKEMRCSLFNIGFSIRWAKPIATVLPPPPPPPPPLLLLETRGFCWHFLLLFSLEQYHRKCKWPSNFSVSYLPQSSLSWIRMT